MGHFNQIIFNNAMKMTFVLKTSFAIPRFHYDIKGASTKNLLSLLVDFGC